MLDSRRTLFVCTGNVFRSIIAEKMFLKYATAQPLSYQARSRGTELYFTESSPDLVAIVSEDYGIDIRTHRPQRLTLGDIAWSTAIVCFTEEHRRSVLELDCAAATKTYLLQDITGTSGELFEDVDYHAVARANAKLMGTIGAISAAIERYVQARTLSIVIPVHNEERNIGRLLKSLLRQPAAAILSEIVVVSSGSTDGTAAVVNSVKSDKVVLLEEPQRNGKISALKQSARAVTGEFVLLIDGDIAVGNGFLEACFAALRGGGVPCTGKILPIKSTSGFFYQLSMLNCTAWNSLRAQRDHDGSFLYPSGYAMVLSAEDLRRGLELMDNTTINDDGLLSLILYQGGTRFHYSPRLEAHVLFPENLRDFFIQKIRTRMGRRQSNRDFFKGVERQWRTSLIRSLEWRTLRYGVTLLILDYLCRCAASLTIPFRQSPHLWSPALSTKNLPPT
jgi:glycosyltransferase involved in cell wall biosynthesis/protein-tyrosine-phosphatase